MLSHCFWGHFSELPMGQRAPTSISLRTLSLPCQGMEPTPILSCSQAPVRVWVLSHPGCRHLLLSLTQVLSSGVIQACES